MSGYNALNRATRRVMLALGLANTTTPPDDSQAAQTVQIAITSLETRDSVPLLQLFGVSSVPPVGTDVAVVFLEGDRSKPVGIASNHQKARVRGLKTGEIVIFSSDPDGSAAVQRIYLSAGEILIDGGGKPVRITNASKLRAECPIESTGEIAAMADGAAVHLSTHIHSGVQSGAATTAKPVPGT